MTITIKKYYKWSLKETRSLWDLYSCSVYHHTKEWTFIWCLVGTRRTESRAAHNLLPQWWRCTLDRTGSLMVTTTGQTLCGETMSLKETPG